jgi:predicted transcriptional regulator
MATALRDGLYGMNMREEDLRRVDREDRKTYDIKQLWQRHHEIINLAARGFKNTEIAELLDIDPQTVSNTLNSTLGEEKLAEIRQERDHDAKITRARIDMLRDKALKIYNEVFEAPNEAVPLQQKLKVADTVMLELSGYRVPTKVQTASVNTIITPEQLAELKERGLQCMRESGMLIEAEAKLIPDQVEQPDEPDKSN